MLSKNVYFWYQHIKKFNFDERELEKFIRQCGSAETFPDLVNDYMGKKGMEPKDVYQNANLSRQDFSRVTKPGAKPKRETIYSVAIGLQASWEETTKLLSSVGYAFRKNSKFDVILASLSDDELVKEAAKIKNRQAALQLIKEACLLANSDGDLSEREVVLIGRIGQAMGIELEKIEQISQWVIDRIVWLEQGKMIFEQV